MESADSTLRNQRSARADQPEVAGAGVGADPALDDLVRLAAVMTGADYVYLGWMDPKRLWFQSTYGFAARSQDRLLTGCHWMARQSAPLLLLDTLGDSRFGALGLQLEGSLPCRSYLGVPLGALGNSLEGTLAVLAADPERFSKNHISLMQTLARQAVTRVELVRKTQALDQLQRSWQRVERALSVERNFVAATLDSIPAMVAVLEVSGRIVRINRPCEELTGLPLFTQWLAEEANSANQVKKEAPLMVVLGKPSSHLPVQRDDFRTGLQLVQIVRP